MKNVNLTVDHIADVRIRDFADYSKPEVAQTATVKVNSNTFDITISRDGKIDVKFNGGWFNCFRGKSKTRLADQLASQIDEWRSAIAKPDADALKEKVAANVDSTLVGRFAPAGDGERREVAVYGFSTMREANTEEVSARYNVNTTLIDDYNTHIGISPSSVTVANLGRIVDRIRNGEFGSVSPSAPKADIPKGKLEAWLAFLGRPENVRKLDIIGRLAEYCEIGDNPTREQKRMTGWKGEFARKGTEVGVRQFVLKNLPLMSREIEMGNGETLALNEDHIDVLVDAILLLVANRNKRVDNAFVRAVVDKAAADRGMKINNDQLLALVDALDEIFGAAFFRQTSKMGLDFFYEQKTPVMFYWTNHQGQTMPEDNRALTEKWWKNSKESFLNHYGASITFSEMRHVQKMRKSDPAFDVLRIEGERV